MSGSSYWPMSAVYVQGTAPLSRIQATATEVSRPPEKAIPTRSPTGREVSTLDTRRSMHDREWSCVGGSTGVGADRRPHLPARPWGASVASHPDDVVADADELAVYRLLGAD